MLQDNLLLEFIIIKKPGVFWEEDQRVKVPFWAILGLYAINMIYDSGTDSNHLAEVVFVFSTVKLLSLLFLEVAFLEENN